MTTLLTTLLAMLLSLVPAARSSAQGRLDQWPTLRQTFVQTSQTIPHPAVVRVVVAETNGASVGSGTLVDAHDHYGLVVTNWHVVRDAQGPISVVFADGYRSAAQILKMDRDWDLAALAVWRPATVAPVTLAQRAPRPGDVLTIAGYGAGPYRAASGRCTQYVAPEKNLPYEMVELAAAARQGDSGGPIFNDRGELAGVLFGSNGKTTSGSFAGRVQTFLAPAQLVLRQPGSQAIALQARPAIPAPSIGQEIRVAPQVALRPAVIQPSHISAQEIQPTSPGNAPVTLRSEPPPLESVRADQFAAAEMSPKLPKNAAQDAPAGTRPIAPLEDDRLADLSDVSSPASRTSGRVPGEYLVTNPSTSEPPSPNPATIDHLLGNSPLEWAKSLFALIGLLAVLLHTARMVGERRREAVDQDPDDDDE